MREGGSGEEHSALLWFDTDPLTVLSVRQVDKSELLDAAELSPSVVRLQDEIAQLGALDLGQGAVGELLFDARGRLWATLPEAGEILRIELR